MTKETGPAPVRDAMRIVIVGGVAGGMSAAARARRLDEHAEIIVLEQGAYVSFANCGLPYHLSGEIADSDELLMHTPESLAESLNLDVRTGHRVTVIDRAAKKITVQADQNTHTLAYDALLLSPGAVAVRPPIEGLDHPACTPLRSVPDVDALRARIDDLMAARGQVQPGPSAVVIGAGSIGLEAVEALTARGLAVHLVELADHVLPPIDAELAPLLKDELTTHGVDLRLGVSAQAVRAVTGARIPVNMLGFVAQNVMDATMPQWQAEDLDLALTTTLILDVRSRPELAEGHIDGALNITHLELRQRLGEVSELAAKGKVSVYCASGVRSYLATRVLLSAGFQALNLSGGWLTLQPSTQNAARPGRGSVPPPWLVGNHLDIRGLGCATRITRQGVNARRPRRVCARQSLGGHRSSGGSGLA